MKIFKNMTDQLRLAQTDACSHLTVFMANQIGHSGMARIGNYSVTDNGSIIGNGLQMLDNGFGLALRQQAIPMERNLLASPNVEHFYLLPPTALVELHCQVHPGIDIRSQCAELGLTDSPCDGEFFVRCCVESSFANFVEQRGGRSDRGTAQDVACQRMRDMYPPYSTSCAIDRNIYSFFNYEGIFQKIEYFDGYSLAQMKFFKWVNAPDVFALLFAPNTSGIWLNPYRGFSSQLYLSTNIHTVRGNAGISFLENRGNLNELDWCILEHGTPSLIWECPAYRGLLYRNRLAEVLQIVGSAKLHHIDLAIEKAVFREEHLEQWGAEEVTPVPLTKKQLIEEADLCDIDVPEILIDDPYEISVRADSFLPDNLPFFWDKRDSVLFYGSGQEAMLQTLIRTLCTSEKWDAKVLLLVPDCDKFRVACMLEAINTSNRLFMDTTNILKEPRALKRRIIDNDISVVFFCIGKNITEEVYQGLVLCRKHKVATAVFVNAADSSNILPAWETIWTERFETVYCKDGFVIDTGDKILKLSIDITGAITQTEGTSKDMQHAKLLQERHG